MKKQCHFFEKLTITLFAAAFCVSFLSCDNFLDAGNVKDEIEYQIYVNNNECPVAAVEEPAFVDVGVAKNKSIAISFTLPVDPETFENSLSIESADGTNLRSKFLEPQWSNNNTLVIIPANELNLIDLKGSKTMDIYVELSKECKTRDNLPIKSAIKHKYRINNNIDDTPPEFTAISATLPSAYIKYREASEPIELIEGAIADDKTEELVCRTNHIKDKFDLYVEGNDNGGGIAYAIITWQRIFEVAGNDVIESVYDYKLEMNNLTEEGNYYGNYTIDLSDSKYLDGMYKVSISIFDSCEVEGTETKEYYVIRDTSLSPSPNALMWFQSPMFRQDSLGYDAWDPVLSGIDYFPEVGEYDSQDATFDFIESFRNHIQFNYISDDLYYISKYGNKKEFKQSSNDFIYLLSWGISLDDMSTPMIVEGHEETDPRLVSGYMGSMLYKMPSEYIQWRAENESNDIFVKATMVDSVGNEQSIETLIPAFITFYNYEVIDIYNDQSEIDTAHKKIKLNYSDFTQSSKQYNPKLPDKTFFELYRIFVGKIDDSNGELSEDQIKAQTLITRNTVYCYENDPWSNLTDKCEFEIDVGSRYFVCIQPNFTTHSKTTGVWTGQTFGPAYSLIVDEYGSGNPPDKPVIYYNENDDSDSKNLKKESCGPNTGKFRITLTIANPQEGVQYVPCYSIDDGQTWSSFEAQTSSTIVFEVPTCLKPPLGVGEIWNPAPVNDKTDWGDVYGVDFFGAIKNAREKAVAQGEDEYYTTPTKIKIIAIKDHASNESEGYWILNFGEDDDNIPPVQANLLIRHDSKLSFDGHYFTYYKLITDEECHPQETFTYYYAPYDESWGNRLSVMDEQSILALPCARSTYQQNCWIEDWKDSPQLGWAQYALAPKIYVNGLEDGNYMFFAKVDDTHGNSSIVTLGKANIGTFKNKLSVKYIKANNKFEAKLVLEDDETSFDRNMICMETLGDEWYFVQGEENALIDCEKRTEGGRQVLYNLTPDRWTDRTGNDITNQCKMWTGNFYRFTIQSFNDNSYNEQTGSGVNYKYGRPYSENEWDQQLSYDNTDTESEYDVCTDETVSNTFYYYVPWNEDDYPEDFSNFMASFFPDTATPISNHKYIVNVISSMRDLGNDPDEWERRGKLIKTHKYDPDSNLPNPDNYVGGENNKDYISALAYYNNYSTKVNSFDRYVAQADMAEAGELGLVYYAAVVHFADNSQVVSDVYTMYGF